MLQRAAAAGGAAYFKGLELRRKLEALVRQPKRAEPGAIYGFNVRTIDQREKKLSDYKGRAMLIANTASLCGFTPQYDSLEALHKTYQARGLSVLAFPANEFAAQEPGGDAEIAQFCRSNYSTTFDLFSKVVVKGPDIHPLFKFLTTESGHNGPIAWNFTKFLVGRDGRVAARFEPTTDPLAKAVTRKVEELLAG